MSRRRPRQPQEADTTPPPPIPFVFLPLPQLPGAAPLSLQQMLYQIALQQAQQQRTGDGPIMFERDWLGTWN
jgi:hypothetical protein